MAKKKIIPTETQITETPAAPSQPEAPVAPTAPVVPEKKEEKIVPVISDITPSANKPAAKNLVNDEFKDADASMYTARILKDVNSVVGRKRYVLKKGTVVKLPVTVYENFKNAGAAL